MRRTSRIPSEWCRDTCRDGSSVAPSFPTSRIVEKTRQALQEITQPTQSADVAVVRGRLRDPEDLGSFAVCELLEVAKCQDLAIHGLHAIERGLKLELTLGPGGRLARVVNRPKSWAASETELACGQRLGRARLRDRRLAWPYRGDADEFAEAVAR